MVGFYLAHFFDILARNYEKSQIFVIPYLVGQIDVAFLAALAQTDGLSDLPLTIDATMCAPLVR